jgi:hypothetical protein
MGNGRRRFLLATAALASTASAWLAEACSPTAPQTFLPDVSLPSFDSAAAPLVVDGGPQPVRVSVVSMTGPSVGTVVVFHDASGKVLASTTTDSAGHAERMLDAGAGVSVLMGSVKSGTLSAVTYLGVEPGDLLFAYDTTTTPTYAYETIQSLASPTPTGAVSYQPTTGTCTTSPFTQLPATFFLSSDCFNRAGRFPVLVEAFDNGSANLGFSFLKDQAIDSDGGVWMDAATWSSGQATWTANLTNGSVAPQVTFGEVASFVPIPHIGSAQPLGDGGFVPSQWSFHPGYADFFQTEVSVSNPTNVGATITLVATRSPATTKDGSVTFDLGQLPPAISTLTSDFLTTPAQPNLTFKPDAPVPSAVGTYAVFTWTNPGTSNSWTIVAPPTLTTIMAPELPPTAVAWTPTTMLNASVPEVVMMSGEGLKSYAEFRKAAAALPPPNFNMLPIMIAPMLPFDGTLALTAVGNPG